MELVDTFFVQPIGDRWTFGRSGTAFETFPTKELAIARANAFAEQHPAVKIVIVDEESRKRRA